MFENNHYYMQEELNKFYKSFEKSQEEKIRLLIDFDTEINKDLKVKFSEIRIEPMFKKKEIIKSSIKKVDIIDLKKSTKNKLF